ncbi:MAG: B12-binding domain-containing radical SAM protein [Candidatus Omnitrophica bacterium]|nr:B12-binding domain-containing radical SAM protein [Candidatus Omnitrophota bacterium]
MIDLALIQTPPWGAVMPSLGLAYLSSYLKARGLQVRVYDMNAELFNNACDKGLWDFERKDEWSDRRLFEEIKNLFYKDIRRFLDEILSEKPLAVGLSVNQNSMLFSLEFAKMIKQTSDAPVIAGGWVCYNKHERDFLSRGQLIDMFVIGEAEESLHELIANLRINRGHWDINEISRIRGVSVNFKEAECFLSRPAPQNLDALGFPTYEEFDLSGYQESILPILSSRGCVGRCVFCNDRVYQGALRLRSPQSIVGEMEYHLENNNISSFCFNDLLINGNLNHLESWCDEIIKRGLNVRWIAQAVSRGDMDYDLFSKIKRAGCHTLQFGIETGSSKVLRKMRKMFTVTDAERALAFARQAGIGIMINLMVGFPGEQEEDFRDTMDFIRRNRSNIDRFASVNACNAVFNSELRNNPQDYGIILSGNLQPLEVNWHTLDGNRDSLRKQRVRRMVSLAEELGISIGQTNLFLKFS